MLLSQYVVKKELAPLCTGRVNCVVETRTQEGKLKLKKENSLRHARGCDHPF
jgi:hypothetical protein